MTKILTLAALTLALVGISSCKKYADAVAKEATDGTLTATVNGQPYTAQLVGTLITNSNFDVKGSEYASDKRMNIGLSGYEKGKTKYNLGYGLNTASFTDENGNTKRSNEGEIEITLTGDKSAKGTFHFKSDSGLEVTDGKFDIKWD